LEQHRARASLHRADHFSHHAVLLPPLHCSRAPPPHGCQLQVRARHGHIPRPPPELPSMPCTLCLTPRATPTTVHRWQFAPSSLGPSQAVRRKRAVALPFTGSTSSPEGPWAHRILTFPHPRVNSAATAFPTNLSSPVRLLSTSFFIEGLRGIAHLTDLSPLIAGQLRGSTPRRPPSSSCKGGGWSLCATWRSSSSSSLTRRCHRTSQLHPSSLSAVYVKRWYKWTSLSYSSHPPLHIEPTLVPAGDWEHHSGERAPPHATVHHRVPVSRQAGPHWVVQTEQASRDVSRAGPHAGPQPEIQCG
jgi:hypothetical protein